jgi:hypothetical protein
MTQDALMQGQGIDLTNSNIFNGPRNNGAWVCYMDLAIIVQCFMIIENCHLTPIPTNNCSETCA